MDKLQQVLVFANMVAFISCMIVYSCLAIKRGGFVPTTDNPDKRKFEEYSGYLSVYIFAVSFDCCMKIVFSVLLSMCVMYYLKAVRLDRLVVRNQSYQAAPSFLWPVGIGAVICSLSVLG